MSKRYKTTQGYAHRQTGLTTLRIRIKRTLVPGDVSLPPSPFSICQMFYKALIINTTRPARVYAFF